MVSGASIIEQASIILMDEAYARWTLPELCTWVNAGVKAIVLAKPSACSTSRVLELEEGTLQRIAQVDGLPTPLLLLSINRNLSSADPRIGGRPVRAVGRAMLELTDPFWHDPKRSRFTKEVKHYVYDENNPLEFYVYPGNNGEGMVEAVISGAPSDLVAVGAGDTIEHYAGDVGLPEPYSGPLLDYVLYRAFAKDDLTGNAGRSQAHYAQFATAVGLKIQVERAVSPNATRGSN